MDEFEESEESEKFARETNFPRKKQSKKLSTKRAKAKILR